MVARERIKRAETEDELQEVRKEKDALREALRVVEGENGFLRSASLSSGTPFDRSDQSPPGSTFSELPPDHSSTVTPPSPSPGWQPPPDVTLDEVPQSEFASYPSHQFKSIILEPAPKPSFISVNEHET